MGVPITSRFVWDETALRSSFLTWFSNFHLFYLHMSVFFLFLFFSLFVYNFFLFFFSFCKLLIKASRLGHHTDFRETVKKNVSAAALYLHNHLLCYSTQSSDVITGSIVCHGYIYVLQVIIGNIKMADTVSFKCKVSTMKHGFGFMG